MNVCFVLFCFVSFRFVSFRFVSFCLSLFSVNLLSFPLFSCLVWFAHCPQLLYSLIIIIILSAIWYCLYCVCISFYFALSVLCLIDSGHEMIFTFFVFAFACAFASASDKS